MWLLRYFRPTGALRCYVLWRLFKAQKSCLFMGKKMLLSIFIKSQIECNYKIKIVGKKKLEKTCFLPVIIASKYRPTLGAFGNFRWCPHTVFITNFKNLNISLTLLKNKLVAFRCVSCLFLHFYIASLSCLSHITL